MRYLKRIVVGFVGLFNLFWGIDCFVNYHEMDAFVVGCFGAIGFIIAVRWIYYDILLNR